jgi:hypothetical protein
LVAVVRLAVVEFMVGVEADARSGFVLDRGLAEMSGFHGWEGEFLEVVRTSAGGTHGLLLGGGQGEGEVRERIESGFMSVESLERAGARRMNVRLG